MGESLGTSVVESNDGGYIMAGIANSHNAGAEDVLIVKMNPANVPSRFGKFFSDDSSQDKSLSIRKWNH